MARPAYALHTEWFVPGASIPEVVGVLGDVASLPRWWPDVYRSVRIVRPGGPHGEGCVADLVTKGFLPYHLRWRLRVTSVDHPRSSEVTASGDLEGRGVWTFGARDGGVAITYDWEVRAGKPLLRYGSVVLRPLFTANHRWAMATGERRLREEVLRRRRA